MSAVRHTVLFRVNDRARIDQAADVVAGLAELSGLASFELVRGLELHPPAYHLMVVTTHVDEAALTAYRADPRHALIVEQLEGLADQRATFDQAIENATV
jgi:quinol monooxygenase YgiN